MPARLVRYAAAALAVLPLAASAAPQKGAGASPAGKTELTWYGHSAFVLRTPGGTVLAIDPWFANPRSPDKEAGTMDPAGAALAASFVKARTVIPMHFGTFPVLPGTPKELEAALEGKAKVLVLEPGKPTPL